jgi:N utilization substance protein B
MLNRRLLRIKVVQTLYSLMQSKESNYHLGLEEIADAFAPDLMAEEKQDLLFLENQKKAASDLYEKFFTSQDSTYLTAEESLKKAVTSAIQQYHFKNASDLKHYEKVMLNDVERVEFMYKSLLFFMSRFTSVVEQDMNEGINSVIGEKEAPFTFKLKDNSYLHFIEANPSLRKYVEHNKINPPMDDLKTLYKKHIKKDSIYKEYAQAPSTTDEVEKQIVLHIAKVFLLKSEMMQGLWEDMDYNWVENESMVKSLLVKALKGMTSDLKEHFVLPDLSPNWEEDLDFMKELYQKTIQLESETENYLSPIIKNWDMERLAVIDRIILRTALTEMIHFSNIPVKVSINEYIDISKIYSTPKSKQFVNGLLDTLSDDLTKQGIIKKSGRGLIDNK